MGEIILNFSMECCIQEYIYIVISFCFDGELVVC